MCGACGSGAVSGWYEAGIGNDRQSRVAAQTALVAEISALFAVDGIRATPVSGGVRIIIADRTGRQRMVQGPEDAVAAARQFAPHVSDGDLRERLDTFGSATQSWDVANDAPTTELWVHQALSRSASSAAAETN
jgi:hypothetical protein